MCWWWCVRKTAQTVHVEWSTGATLELPHLQYWCFRWWLMFTVNPLGLESPWRHAGSVSMKVFLEKVNWGGANQAGRHRLRGMGLRLSKIRNGSEHHFIFLCFVTLDRGYRLAHALLPCLSHMTYLQMSPDDPLKLQSLCQVFSHRNEKHDQYIAFKQIIREVNFFLQISTFFHI